MSTTTDTTGPTLEGVAVDEARLHEMEARLTEVRTQASQITDQLAQLHTDARAQSEEATRLRDMRQRLAQFVPPPRMHRHRYHGVLAPRQRFALLTEWRARATALGRPEPDEPASEHPDGTDWQIGNSLIRPHG